MTDPIIDPLGTKSDETSQADWEARRDELAGRLANHRASATVEAAQPGGSGLRGASDGLRLASEFVAGILAGAGIGYLFDRIVGTSPFGLIVFLLLGFVAGVLNVLRAVGKSVTAPPGVQKDAANSENDTSE